MAADLHPAVRAQWLAEQRGRQEESARSQERIAAKLRGMEEALDDLSGSAAGAGGAAGAGARKHAKAKASALSSGARIGRETVRP